MSIGLLFWILMLFWLLFRGWGHWSGSPAGYYPLGGDLLLFILLLLLGWGEFGAPIRG